MDECHMSGQVNRTCQCIHGVKVLPQLGVFEIHAATVVDDGHLERKGNNNERGC